MKTRPPTSAGSRWRGSLSPARRWRSCTWSSGGSSARARAPLPERDVADRGDRAVAAHVLFDRVVEHRRAQRAVEREAAHVALDPHHLAERLVLLPPEQRGHPGWGWAGDLHARAAGRDVPQG